MVIILTTNTKYVAGSCNIGSAEISQRKRIGFVGLAVTGFGFLVYIFSILSLDIDPLVGLLFIFPVTTAAIGFIQARNKFCAAYGFASVVNVSFQLGTTMKIDDEKDRKKDRNKAIIISVQAILIGLITAVIITILGFNIKQL